MEDMSGSGTPFLAHDVGFLTLGPTKLDPLLDPSPPPSFSFACRPKMDLLFKNPGSAPGWYNWQDCFQDISTANSPLLTLAIVTHDKAPELTRHH